MTDICFSFNKHSYESDASFPEGLVLMLSLCGEDARREGAASFPSYDESPVCTLVIATDKYDF